MLGEPVARRLAADGHTVRVMSRTLDRGQSMFGSEGPRFEPVEADVEDEDVLRMAMMGCTGVHINLQGAPGDWDLERRGVELASKVASETNGIKRITFISGASVCEENAWFPLTKAKLEAENAIKASGVEYTIFRCTMFNETLPKYVRGTMAIVLGEQKMPWHWIAAEDYAAMVSKAFSVEEAANKTLYVYGPEALTMEEAIKIYISVCAPNAKILKMPLWMARLIAWVPGNGMLRKLVVPLFTYFTKVKELGDGNEANALLGAPTMTVQAWCEASRAGQK